MDANESSVRGIVNERMNRNSRASARISSALSDRISQLTTDESSAERSDNTAEPLAMAPSLASPLVGISELPARAVPSVASPSSRPSVLGSPSLPARSLFGSTYDTLDALISPVGPIVAAKETEDVSYSSDNATAHNGRLQTPAVLTRMLASKLTHTPSDSRSTSYNHGNPSSGNSNFRTSAAYHDPSSVSYHLYHHGLLQGKHSDIAVLTFNHRYNLHRLVLVRAPFFTKALSGPWVESSAREIELFPEETDRNITQAAFELALKHLYGCPIASEADAEAMGLFATGCWLEMPELVEMAIASILKQMTTDMLSPIFDILNEQYYGSYAERILGSAKAILCRDGWEMPLKHWDSVPGDVVAEVVGGDGFFVNGEWERWVLAKRLLDRRLKQQATELGLLDNNKSGRVRAPHHIAHRLDPNSKRTPLHASNGKGTASRDEDDKWEEVYSNSTVIPLFQLLRTGIHYVHLDFEQLQYIRGARDIFDLPMIPDMVIANALWMQMELRQKVVNARETDLELGLSYTMTDQPPAGALGRSQHAQMASEEDEERASHAMRPSYTFLNVASDSRFAIPTADCTILMGDSEPLAVPSSTYRHTRTSTIPTNPPPTETTNTTVPSPDPRRFFAYPSETNNSSWQTPAEMRTAPTSPTSAAAAALYTTYPPFRFAVEFPNPRFIKEKRRVYSRTIFYAGSLWNVYVQKVKSQKNPQLGVYLHRAREEGHNHSASADVDGMGSSLQGTTASVDDRIGQLEREMILRSGERRTGHNPASSTRSSNGRDTLTRQRQLMMRYGALEHTETSIAGTSSANVDNDTGSIHSNRTRRTMGRPYTSRQHHQHPDGALESYISLDSEDSDDEDYLFDRDGPAFWSSSTGLAGLPRYTSPHSVLPSSFTTFPNTRPSVHQTTSPPATSSSGLPSRSTTTVGPSTPHQQSSSHRQPTTRSTPTLPPYTDPRSTIKTYFKIFSPSKRGRLLSVYESAPDKFDISQSWGWRSGSLMMEEGVDGAGADAGPDGLAAGSVEVDGDGDGAILEGASASASASASVGAGVDRDSRWRRRGEGNLRFMIVIGNL